MVGGIHGWGYNHHVKMLIGQPNLKMMIAAWAHIFCIFLLLVDHDRGVYECEKIGISTTDYKSRILSWDVMGA